MERRKAIATAGAVTATATAAVIALGANFGIFGLADENSKVGKFPAVEATTSVPGTTPSPTAAHQDDDRSPARDADHRAERHEDD